jgi:hypothetical protein
LSKGKLAVVRPLSWWRPELLEKELTEKEAAYLKELRKYVNKWVAVLESEEGDIIVGSGNDAVEAKRDAQSKGFDDIVLFWVRPPNVGFIP